MTRRSAEERKPFSGFAGPFRNAIRFLELEMRSRKMVPGKEMPEPGESRTANQHLRH